MTRAARYAYFVLAWLVHLFTGWQEFAAEQMAHGEMASVWGEDGYVHFPGNEPIVAGARNHSALSSRVAVFMNRPQIGTASCAA